MRPFASIVWVVAFAFSTFISGVLPAHSPFETGHALAERLAADPSSSAQAVAGQQLAPSVYPPLPNGYPATPPCQVNPSQLPPNWPTTVPPPFTSTFDAFLTQNQNALVPPGSPPVNLKISEVPTTNITPRVGFSMPYQLLYSLFNASTGQYDPMYPGPTIRVVSQQSDKSTLTIGSDVQTSAPPPMTQVSVTNGVFGNTTNVPFPFFTTHLHGGHTPPEHDGHPDDLNPPMPTMAEGGGTGPLTVMPHVYSYTNDQQSQILWYHDHADMNTSPHVSSGLFAFYIIEENQEDMGYGYLPTGAYDIPLGFQAMTAGTQTINGVSVPNYFVAVNGLDSPKLDVEERFYRFRLLNASAGQSISVELCDANGNNLNHLAYVIGTDGGMMAQPVQLSQRPLGMFQDGRLDVFQAERYDLLVDFTGLAGQQVYMTAMVRGPNGCLGTVNPSGGSPAQCINQETPILQFNVGALASTDPTNLSMIGNASWDGDTQFLQTNHPSSIPDRVFSFDRLTLGTVSSPTPPTQFLISNQPYDMFRLTYSGDSTAPFPQVIKPALVNANSVEIWEFQNTVSCAIHPVHVHDIEFQVTGIDGQPISPTQARDYFGWKDIFVLPPLHDKTNCPWIPPTTTGVNPAISFIGYYESHWVQSPSLAEIGDTIPWQATTSGTIYTALTSGTYVFHCHNLGHEDNVMMGQFQVAPPPMPASMLNDQGPVTVVMPSGPGQQAGRGMPGMAPGPGMAPAGAGPPGQQDGHGGG